MAEFGGNFEVSEVAESSGGTNEVSESVQELNDEKLEPPADDVPDYNKKIESDEIEKPENNNEQQVDSQPIDNLENINELPLEPKEDDDNCEQIDEFTKNEHTEQLFDEKAMEDKTDLKENENSDIKSSSDDKLSAEDLRFGSEKYIDSDDKKSDVDKARDDWKFARMEREAYKELVKSGELPKDKDVAQAFDDAVKNTKQTFTDVRNGQPYSFEKPSDYWKSKEGKEIAGEIGAKVTDVVVSKLIDAFGVKLPQDVEDNISEMCQEFGKYIGEYCGYKMIGNFADDSKKLMENVYDTYTPQVTKEFNSTFIFKDENGNYITAEQARELAFKDEND